MPAGLAHRTVTLSEGAGLCWNANNFLSAVIMARSAMEAAAISFDFYQRVQKGVDARDISVIDAATMTLWFGTRHEGAGETLPRSRSVLSLIDN